ncbi:DNA mismatch repair protein MutL [Trichodelitschia bisporula]|uniref:DNA mismatch repair protein PMS1 n=1 Tax=Trichodelitschia bisporula TaxID=703511 RepID=A0A6G1I1Y0_9PEZI|nr:DNA mismatch repair protein MutL [Trichodelitschia bisporula]
MASIKAIESRSVHQIQSGQVIVDLCSVVKELVENSLDAGASSIEVRFRNNGIDAIEVQDNGSGIAPADYETVALKHYTSKLASYADLTSLSTFGFRGEALSSLCALSDFHILTARATDGAKGTRLDFEISGKLRGTSVVACQKGTTVVVENLFKNLPVRRRELERNVKREYGKVLTLLQAYACISTGVKVAVSNQPKKGKKVVAFATNANPTTRENIANVYGAKTLTALIPLDLSLEMVPTEPGHDSPHTVHLRGHISRPVVGEGRQTPDRQMFFVNARPCALPQVSKAINEVYKSYNITQSPFIFANLVMDTNAYDVNVSPDKRTILLHDQAALLDTLKESLHAMFAAHEQSVPAAMPAMARRTATPGPSFVSARKLVETADDSSSIAPNSPPMPTRSRPTTSTPSAEPSSNPASPRRILSYGPPRSRVFTRPYNDGFSSNTPVSVSKQPTITSAFARISHGKSPSPDPDESIPAISSSRPPPSSALQSALAHMRPRRAPAELATITIGERTTVAAVGTGTAGKRRRVQEERNVVSTPLLGRLRRFAAPGTAAAEEREEEGDEEEEEEVEDISDGEDEEEAPAPTAYEPRWIEPAEGSGDEAPEPGAAPASAEPDEGPASRPASAEPEDEPPASRPASPDPMPTDPTSTAEPTKGQTEKAEADALSRATRLLRTKSKKYSTLHLTTTLSTSPSTIAASTTLLRTALSPYAAMDLEDTGEVDGVSAEERLSLTVRKVDFARMRVVGQFNKGFIIAVRPGGGPGSSPSDETPAAGTDETFIIDQHAADEKYNFERLAASTALHPQRLVRPLPLSLSAADVETLANNNAALAKNGFAVEVTTSENGEQTAMLTALPMSKEIIFAPEDLEELLALLSEGGGGAVPRPGKVRKILASRACRSSVMVGTDLDVKKMGRVVRQLGGMDKPWNCPHGRPTMRHLAGLGGWRGWGEGEETDWGAYAREAM